MIMVLNLGTTSFKFKLFDFEAGEEPVANGLVERIGTAESDWRFTSGDVRKNGSTVCADHKAAFQFCLQRLETERLIGSLDELDGVGFKTVHGGPLRGAVAADERVLAVLDEYAAFAPAHNPMYANLMRRLREKFPQLRQVACFETSFHADIPLARTVYGVPFDWVEKYGIRRYGFHGSSHSYIAAKMRELAPEARKIISLHLGGSSSLCAIADGKSVASSMGATPQSGLFQNNRVGDFDAFCLPRLTEAYGSPEKVMKTLAMQSGFLGLSGVSNDLRDVLQAATDGNQQAQLAFDAFVDNCIGYIGMFTAYLQGMDALVFTGGIGKNCTLLRERVCARLEYLGLRLDPKKTDGRISSLDSLIQIWTLETDEELMVARQTRDALAAMT
ncbi:MAG: acetate/propionate family kinase [Victivallaceae bacterium]|nr:acetate/propionate family kinase [Victivallaceae bacterium]